MRIEDDLRYALSPVDFASECLGIDPDPWQADVLLSPRKRILLNCCRQSGKSTTAAILALHKAIYRPKSLILLFSPSLRQSQELFRKVAGFLKLLPFQPKMLEENKLSMELQTLSRIVSLPGSGETVRGFSASLIIEDEAARVDDELYVAIRPMLATSEGSLVLMSTPFGKRGHFFQAWENDEDWKKVKVPATECPRIEETFLEEERRNLGDWAYRQEYLCEFVEDDDQFFSHDLIERAFSDGLRPLEIF